MSTPNDEVSVKPDRLEADAAGDITSSASTLPAGPTGSKASTREKRGRRVGRTLLLFAGSALFGGLAVALWERKTLAEIRRREAEGPLEVPQSRED